VSGLGVSALAVCVTSVVSVARADQTTGTAVAEALFRDAVQLLLADKVDEACPKFLESQAIDPSLGTLLYLATCHEKQGRTASAWSEFTSAKDWAERTNQGERAAFARRHLAPLEERLSSVVLRAPAIPGMHIKVDNGVLSVAALGTPLPLDPGQHTIAVEAEGYMPWHTAINIPAEPGKTEVTVPVLEPVHSSLPPPSTTTTPGESAATTGSTAHAGSSVPLWASVGVASAGVVVGAIFGAFAMGARNSASNACQSNHYCTQSGLDDIDHAKTFATVSTIGFGVGLGGALVAGYFALRGSGEPAAPRASTGFLRTLTVAPMVSPNGAGLALGMRLE
jgi:hypothetical protein